MGNSVDDGEIISPAPQAPGALHGRCGARVRSELHCLARVDVANSIALQVSHVGSALQRHNYGGATPIEPDANNRIRSTARHGNGACPERESARRLHLAHAAEKESVVRAYLD